jgi:hypothetical protein
MNYRFTISILLLSIALFISAEPSSTARTFLDGQRTTFSTKGHAKAKGANFTIAYPNNWTASEGERPNIVQKFVGEGSDSLVNVMIITKEFPLPPINK